jgi:hypothetical protein
LSPVFANRDQRGTTEDDEISLVLVVVELHTEARNEKSGSRSGFSGKK